MSFRSQFGSAAAVLALCATCSVLVFGTAEGEDELKCATLLAFIQNTHWADSSAADGTLTVGVVGRPAFIRSLRTGLEGKNVGGRTVQVLQMQPGTGPRCCQVIYFATNKDSDIKPALQSSTSVHVLTMGESDHFLEQGGAVNLFLVDGHMAFEVSMAALERAGIEISSKLLRFGQIRDLPKRHVR